MELEVESFGQDLHSGKFLSFITGDDSVSIQRKVNVYSI